MLGDSIRREATAARAGTGTTPCAGYNGTQVGSTSHNFEGTGHYRSCLQVQCQSPHRAIGGAPGPRCNTYRYAVCTFKSLMGQPGSCEVEVLKLLSLSRVTGRLLRSTMFPVLKCTSTSLSTGGVCRLEYFCGTFSSFLVLDEPRVNLRP
jgi:hypothetical protein